MTAPRVGHGAFVLSHPFRKEREMDGAPGICVFPTQLHWNEMRVLRLRFAALRMTAPRVGHGAFVLSHPFRKEREMDGAPGICVFPTQLHWNEMRVLRLRFAALRMTAPRVGYGAIVLSHPFREEREMVGAPDICAFPPQVH